MKVPLRSPRSANQSEERCRVGRLSRASWCEYMTYCTAFDAVYAQVPDAAYRLGQR